MVKIKRLTNFFGILTFIIFVSVFEVFSSSPDSPEISESDDPGFKTSLIMYEEESSLRNRLLELENKYSVLEDAVSPFSNIAPLHPNQFKFMNEVRRPITSFFASEIIAASGKFQLKEKTSKFMLAVAAVDMASLFCPPEAQIIIGAVTSGAKIAHAGYKYITREKKEYYVFSSFSEVDRVSYAIALRLASMHREVLTNLKNTEDSIHLGTVVAETIKYYLKDLSGEASKLQLVTTDFLVCNSFNKVYREAHRKLDLWHPSQSTLANEKVYCKKIEMIDGEKYWDAELLLGSNLKVVSSDKVEPVKFYKNNYEGGMKYTAVKHSDKPPFLLESLYYTRARNNNFVSTVSEEVFDFMKKNGYRGKTLEKVNEIDEKDAVNLTIDVSDAASIKFGEEAN